MVTYSQYIDTIFQLMAVPFYIIILLTLFVYVKLQSIAFTELQYNHVLTL